MMKDILCSVGLMRSLLALAVRLGVVPEEALVQHANLLTARGLGTIALLDRSLGDTHDD